MLLAAEETKNTVEDEVDKIAVTGCKGGELEVVACQILSHICRLGWSRPPLLGQCGVIFKCPVSYDATQYSTVWCMG